MTPTARSLKHMRSLGYRAEVVEKWNSFTRTRKDLFGILDVLAVGDGETVGIQVTSGSNVSARVRKIADSDSIADIRKAGWRVVVHGWRKNAKGRWMLREVDCS